MPRSPRRSRAQRIADRQARARRAPRERADRERAALSSANAEYLAACEFWARLGARHMPAIVEHPGR